uniref:Uncharacterized protein n=1 Tax=Echinococcus granulosus TaxID=6210 RepID=A0A068WP60_ECHGR|nr:hypothetical protein EgrG_000076800 [Echinococcus granulosus]
MLLQWMSEVPSPFPLSDARAWLRRYLVSNHGDAVKVDEFLSFLQSNDYIKIICYEKRNLPLFYPNDESLCYAHEASNSCRGYGNSASERMERALYYRSLSLKLLKRLTSYLPDNVKNDLHPSLHYKNLSIVKEILNFPPLETCKFCSDWLTEIGENIYHNRQESGIDLSSSLLVHLDFLRRCPDSSVLSKENMADVLNDIVRTIVKLLKTFDFFVPPNPITVSLFKLVLQRPEVQKRKNRQPPSAWIGNRMGVLSSMRDPHVQRPTESEVSTSKVFRRSQSMSPGSRRLSLNSIDLHVNMSFSRPFMMSGRLQRAHSDIFNPTDCVERALRLATTLLCPNTCSIIAHLTAAIRSIRSNTNREGFQEDYFPLSSVECMAVLMAPILFPVVSQRRVTHSSRLDCGEWREALLTTLFSADAGKCIQPAELLLDIVDPTKIPSLAKALELTVNCQSSPKVAPLQSSFSRLNIKSSSHGTAAASMGPRHTKLENERSFSSETPSASPTLLQPTLPASLRCSLFSRKPASQQRLANLGKTYELMKLLNGILEDRAMDPKVKLNHLRQFQTFHGDVFWMRFGDVKTAERYFDRLNHRIANASTKKAPETPVAGMPKSSSAFFRRRVRSNTPKPSQ